jgi:aspartate/methionine/tyrosine aminotransferase
MAKFYNLDWIKAENVVVTSGAKPALYTSLLSIIDPGDEVILPVPAWTTTYQPLVELAGGKLIEVQLENNFDLNIQNIFEAMTVRTKAIIINSPHNPTGAIFSKEALTRLADYVRGKNIVIIADDIYSKLIYDKSFFPVSSCDFENLIIINGFSKSQALTGWRVGYLIAELSVAKATTSLLSHITGNAAVLSQYAALEAMKRHDMPPASTLKTLKLQRQLVLDGLDGCGIAHNIPGGAFYIFLDLRPFTIDSVAWCERLLNETGVAIVPGEAFSAPGYARMSFVADEMTLKVALDKINHYIKKKGQV